MIYPDVRYSEVELSFYREVCVFLSFKPVLPEPALEPEEDDDQVYKEEDHGEIKFSVEVQIERCTIDDDPIEPVFQDLSGHHECRDDSAPGSKRIQITKPLFCAG